MMKTNDSITASDSVMAATAAGVSVLTSLWPPAPVPLSTGGDGRLCGGTMGSGGELEGSMGYGEDRPAGGQIENIAERMCDMKKSERRVISRINGSLLCVCAFSR